MSQTGTAADMAARLRALLPARWFPAEAPVLEGLLAGLAAMLATLHAQFAAARAQARLATAEAAFLETIARDFLGPHLRRLAGQGDGGFRLAIGRELVRERATRAGLAAALTDLCANPPAIHEPARPADTGAWGRACGYGAAGGWGSLTLPFQCLVTVRRPPGAGIVQMPGWGIAQGWGAAGGWAGLDMVQGQVTDADIRAATLRNLPAGCTAWLRITS